MIDWYEGDYIGIRFTERPHVDVLYPTPEMSETEKKEIEKKPFICKNQVGVKLTDYDNEHTYNFIIPADYRWDGASIPKMFWRIIGSKEDTRFLIPSMIHDVLCEHHSFVNYDRYFADRVFEKLLAVSGVSNFKRWLMFHSVDNFQKFQGWRAE